MSFKTSIADPTQQNGPCQPRQLDRRSSCDQGQPGNKPYPPAAADAHGQWVRQSWNYRRCNVLSCVHTQPAQATPSGETLTAVLSGTCLAFTAGWSSPCEELGSTNGMLLPLTGCDLPGDQPSTDGRVASELML